MNEGQRILYGGYNRAIRHILRRSNPSHFFSSSMVLVHNLDRSIFPVLSSLYLTCPTSCIEICKDRHRRKLAGHMLFHFLISGFFNASYFTIRVSVMVFVSYKYLLFHLFPGRFVYLCW